MVKVFDKPQLTEQEKVWRAATSFLNEREDLNVECKVEPFMIDVKIKGAKDSAGYLDILVGLLHANEMSIHGRYYGAREEPKFNAMLKVCEALEEKFREKGYKVYESRLEPAK